MFSKHKTLIPAIALLFGSAFSLQGAAQAQNAAPAATTSGQNDTALSHLIWIRMVPFWGNEWQLKGYTGDDLLRMIREVKPDVIERYVQFKPTPEMMVPMANGAAPMKFTDFIQASIKAEAPGGFITPKVHQNDIIKDDERIAEAQAWRDFPVTPRMKLLSLDVRPGHGTAEDHKKMLETFKAQGWDIGFNFAGGGQETFGLGTYAQAAVSKVTWEVSKKELADMDAQGIKTRLAHIDYPPGITAFGQLSPDQQADIVMKLSKGQHELHYTFVYPVFYGRQGYDASKQVTKADGPYKGATVLDVIAEAARCDRAYPKPCTPRFGAK